MLERQSEGVSSSISLERWMSHMVSYFQKCIIPFPEAFEAQCQIFLRNHSLQGVKLPHEVFVAAMSCIRHRCDAEKDQAMRDASDNSHEQELLRRKYEEKLNECRLSVGYGETFLIKGFVMPNYAFRPILEQYKLRLSYETLGWRVLQDQRMSRLSIIAWVVKRFFGF